MHRITWLWRLSKGIGRRVANANLSLVAAGAAFFAMLSLFPGLTAVIAVVGLVADPAIADAQLATISGAVPDEVYSVVEVQIERLVAANSSALGWATAASLVTALWSSRTGTDAILRAVNAVHDSPMRSGFRHFATALGITLALVMVVVVALLTMVLLPVMLALLPTGGFTELAVQLARWAVAVAVVFAGIWVVYRFGPNGPGARIGVFSPGAILSVVFWGAASWGMSYYFSNFAGYDRVYGSIGAVIALLLFLYITIFIVLLGAALNAELQAAGVLEDPSEDSDNAPGEGSDSNDGPPEGGKASISHA